eukprot:scaffold1915_cov288-Prasinococcus_capsulatus_cf.AAC.4
MTSVFAAVSTLMPSHSRCSHLHAPHHRRAQPGIEFTARLRAALRVRESCDGGGVQKPKALQAVAVRGSQQQLRGADAGRARLVP